MIEGTDATVPDFSASLLTPRVNRELKACIPYREVLGAVVELIPFSLASRHAAARPASFVKHRDVNMVLHQALGAC